MTKKGTKKKAKKFDRQDAVPEIDRAAQAYVHARDERMALTEDEVESQAALDQVMLKHDLLEYVYEDDAGVKHRCKVSATRKVSVRKITEKKPPADE